MSSSSQQPLVGGDRFVLGRMLGEGGMGVVYEAFDRTRATTIAVKLVRTRSAPALLRFKSEFRLLRDLRHRNLVALGELFVDDAQPFFTMELVRGQPFSSWLQHDGDGDAESAAASAPRLRDAVAQLADGLAHLHAARCVHRDVKPSNVLVEEGGRVVILDFGLVTHADERDETRGRVVGSHYYMAPEQGADGVVGPAADCYSVGVMLYEALTGTLPFVGRPDKVLAQKRASQPVRPRELVDGVADDLDALCMELLHPDPARRPPAATIAARLRFGRAAERAPARPFVGRSAELARLHAAYARHRSDGAVAMAIVEGESGIGKTTLLARFVEELRHADDDVLVLAGRSCLRESVPYKAVDGIIDDLRRHLAATARDDGDDDSEPALMRALARVFPVFGRNSGDVARPAASIADAQEARAQAFAALRELLRRVAQTRPLVITVEDLHWADDDSLSLLREILHPPAAPPCLVIATTRPLGPDAPVARAILPLPLPIERITLAGLLPDDALLLARRLLGAGDDARAHALAADSGGHPLLLAELASGDTLERRIAQLAPNARALLDTVAMAGAALPRAVVAGATSLGVAELDALATGLATAHLLRADGDVVDVFHDRVREAVVAALDGAARREVIRRLALALESSDAPDHDALVVHWREAGDAARATTHALAAAARAEAALAFHRAAAAYRAALDIGRAVEAHVDAAVDVVVDAATLRVRLAEALANAGRGTDAGRAFVEAASGRDADEALRLRARAADQFLRAGDIDEGVRVLRDVLAAVGLSWPATPRAALWSLLRGRVRVRLRGVRFAARSAADVDARALLRVDACLAAATGLGIVDTIRGADFQTRHLQLALDAGEVSRVALSLGLEASFSAAGGRRTRKHTARALAEAERLSARLGDPFVAGRLLGNAAIVAFLEGRWRSALDYCERGETLFREKLSGVSWERNTVQLFMLNSLAYLGEVKELARRSAGYLLDAQQRGDLFAETNLSTGHIALAALAADDPDGARRRSAAALARWSREGWHLEHYYDLVAQCEAELYAGDAAAAFARISAHWHDVRRSLLMRVQLIRINMLALRMRAALACAAATGDEARRRDAAADARRIARERMDWAMPWSWLARSALATQRRRDESDTLRLLLDAEEGFAQEGMQLHSAAARLRRGQRLGGELGAELVRAAEATMRAQGIRRVDRMAALLAPGFPATT